jgi:hypothetical protein
MLPWKGGLRNMEGLAKLAIVSFVAEFHPRFYGKTHSACDSLQRGANR